MPNLIDLRRRIRTVSNTAEITKAMKMVSAAKLRRAQNRALSTRSFASMMNQMLSNIAAAAASVLDTAEVPLLAVREEKRIQLVVVSNDRGLAGAFSANLLHVAQRFIDDHSDAHIKVEAIGRKARDYFRKRGLPITGEQVGLVEKFSYEDARKIARKIIDLYSSNQIDALYIIANEFKTVMSTSISVNRILPVKLQPGATPIDYIFEQPVDEQLGYLLPLYIEMSIYRAILESVAAENAARMTAMDAATKNAGQVNDALTLKLHRARQSAITTELIEIVSGAAALG